MQSKSSYGDDIRHMRQIAKSRDAGLTLSTVAKHMGFSVGHLMHVEQGTSVALDSDGTLRLCRFLGASQKTAESLMMKSLDERQSVSFDTTPSELSERIKKQVVDFYMQEW
jgi:transcriptional regulator with XRE-family HTH domain